MFGYLMGSLFLGKKKLSRVERESVSQNDPESPVNSNVLNKEHSLVKTLLPLQWLCQYLKKFLSY